MQGGDQALALPHITVPDVAWLDWAVLSRAGFRAAVFDKDNTLTAPFDLSLPPRIAAALSDAASALGGRGALALYSNSAGLQQYDPAGVEAGALEAALGLRVVRHTDKKPAGGVTELAAQLGCALCPGMASFCVECSQHATVARQCWLGSQPHLLFWPHLPHPPCMPVFLSAWLDPVVAPITADSQL